MGYNEGKTLGQVIFFHEQFIYLLPVPVCGDMYTSSATEIHFTGREKNLSSYTLILARTYA